MNGPQGDRGPAGNPGLPGDKGPLGYQGLTGPQGKQGSKNYSIRLFLLNLIQLF